MVLSYNDLLVRLKHKTHTHTLLNYVWIIVVLNRNEWINQVKFSFLFELLLNFFFFIFYSIYSYSFFCCCINWIKINFLFKFFYFSLVSFHWKIIASLYSSSLRIYEENKRLTRMFLFNWNNLNLIFKSYYCKRWWWWVFI